MHSLFDISGYSIFGLLIVIVGIALGNAAGIGGAGIIVPVLIIIFRLSLLETSAQSNVMIFMAFGIKFISNIKQRHPKKNKPLIDFDAVALMAPTSFFGTKIGLIVHDITPQTALLILLMATLTYLSYSTLLRGFTLFKKESAKEEKMMLPIDCLIENGKGEKEVSFNFIQNQRIMEITQQDARMIPAKQAILILILLALIIVTTFIEGGKGVGSIFGVKLCSSAYWGSIIFFGVACTLVIYTVGKDIILHSIEKANLHIPKTEDDIEWTWGKIVEYALYGLCTGILSAIFGIGGGMILTPLLAQLKMLPEVVASTGGVFVLLTTASSSIILISQGYWNVSFGVLTACTALIAAFLSMYLVSSIVKKCERPSILILIMSGIVFTSGILIGSIGLHDQYLKYGTLTSAEAWSFHNFCS